MLYFAYGSNMDPKQMRCRCPSARCVGVACLRDHRLAFSRRSRTWKCGVADAVPAPGRRVWGVVYCIDPKEVSQLDRYEGYGPGRRRNAYRRRACTVHLDDKDASPLAVQTYFAVPQDNPPPPGRSYMERLLAGARHWKLPAAYIAELEDIGTGD